MNLSATKSIFNMRVLAMSGVFAALLASRFLPHAANFSPVLALILFSGAICADRKWAAFVVPLSALFISDMILGFYDGIIFNYLAFAWIVALGMGVLPKASTSPYKMVRVLGAALGSSVLFFVLSNFGVWMMAGLYARTWDGLIQCYVMAIPFFHESLFSTLVSALALFGVYHLARIWVTRHALVR